MDQSYPIITDIKQVTPEWLTDVLTSEGFIGDGSVTAVRIGPRPAWKHSTGELIFELQNPDNARLEVSYSDDVPEDMPTRFFFKLSGPTILGCTAREVDFYNKIAKGMPRSPSMRCFAAARCRETGNNIVLLEDVTETHLSPLPLTHKAATAFVELLTDFQAYWWDHERLKGDLGQVIGESVRDPPRDIEMVIRDFVREQEDRLSGEQKKIYDRLPGIIAPFERRLKEGENLTICNGDAHAGNCLYPWDEQTGGRVYYFDWPMWYVGIGITDLVELANIYPGHSQLEVLYNRNIIADYHRLLLEKGIGQYSLEACWRDLKLSTVYRLFRPACGWASGQPEDAWSLDLEWYTRLFHDFECEELLKI